MSSGGTCRHFNAVPPIAARCKAVCASHSGLPRRPGNCGIGSRRLDPVRPRQRRRRLQRLAQAGRDRLPGHAALTALRIRLAAPLARARRGRRRQAVTGRRCAAAAASAHRPTGGRDRAAGTPRRVGSHRAPRRSPAGRSGPTRARRPQRLGQRPGAAVRAPRLGLGWRRHHHHSRVATPVAAVAGPSVGPDPARLDRDAGAAARAAAARDRARLRLRQSRRHRDGIVKPVAGTVARALSAGRPGPGAQRLVGLDAAARAAPRSPRAPPRPPRPRTVDPDGAAHRGRGLATGSPHRRPTRRRRPHATAGALARRAQRPVQEPQAHRLQLLVVLDRAVMAARHRDQPAARDRAAPRPARASARPAPARRPRRAAAAAGSRARRPPRAGRARPGTPRSAGRSAANAKRPSCQAAAQPLGAGRADGHHGAARRGRRRRRGWRDSRPCSSRAARSAPSRSPSCLAQQHRDHRRHVVDRAGRPARRRSRRGRAGRRQTTARPSATAARAKSWWLSLHESAPWRTTTPARAGGRGAGGQPQRVGQAVAAAAGVGRDSSGVTVRRHSRPYLYHGMIAARERRHAELSHVYPARQPRQRARPPGAGRLRRRRARPRVRHARLRRGRGRPARPGPRLRRRAGRPATATATSCSPPRRSPAPRSIASSRRRAWPATSPPAASWPWRWRAASTPQRIYMHGNAKSQAELREALAAGVGHIVLDSMRRDRAARPLAADAGIRQDVLIRVTPGCRGRHPPRDLHRPGGLEVRLLARPGPRGDRRARRATAGSTSRGCTSTSARSCSSSSPSGPRSGPSPRSATSRVYNLGGGPGAPPTPPTSGRPAPSGGWRRSSTRSTPSSGPASACCSSPAARWSPTPRSRSTRCRRSSATSPPGWRSTAACRTTCAR